MDRSVPASSATPGSTGGLRSFEGWFVWLLWGAMSLMALYFAFRYTSRLPSWDDWYNVMPAILHKPIPLGWYWEPTFGHRMAVPRIFIVLCMRGIRPDIRLIAVAEAAFSVVMSGLLLVVARELRGRTAWEDCFLPVTFLSWGNFHYFTWATMIVGSIPAFLYCVLLILILRGRKGLTPAAGLLAGICLALSPPCGGIGTLTVVFLGPWFAYALLTQRGYRRRSSPIAFFLTLALILAAFLILPVYFIGDKNPLYRPSPSLNASLMAMVQFLSIGFNPASHTRSIVWVACALITLGLFAWCVAVLARAWRQQPDDRLRIAGMAAALVMMVGMAASIGSQRAGAGPGAGLQPRYSLYGSLYLVSLYFAFLLYARPSGARAPQTGLFAVLALLLLPLETHAALVTAQERLKVMTAVTNDMIAGETIPTLLAHNSDKSLAATEGMLADRLPELRDEGIYPYSRIGADPATSPVPLSPTPIHTSEVESAGSLWKTSGRGSALIFALPKTLYATAIRLTYRHDNATHTGPHNFQIYWKRNDQTEFTRYDKPDHQFYECDSLPTGMGGNTVTIYVDAPLDEICIKPDANPCTFGITHLTVVTPAPHS